MGGDTWLSGNFTASLGTVKLESGPQELEFTRRLPESLDQASRLSLGTAFFRDVVIILFH